jgi:16S rRNA (guanine527-N7)-methyltransferase
MFDAGQPDAFAQVNPMSHIQSGRETFLRELNLVGVHVSRETRDQLEALVNTLMRWQKAINLVGKATLEDVWTRHLLDSAQLTALIPHSARSLVDMGSGAGFPGLVLAALRPELDVTLIEADARKAAFLGEAARRMGLAKPPTVVVGRIEVVAPVKAEIITARALAPLAQLLAWANPHRTDATICLFHKGKGWQAELSEAMNHWQISSQPFTSVTDLDAVILRIGPYSSATAATANDPVPPGNRNRQPKGRRRQDNDGD